MKSKNGQKHVSRRKMLQLLTALGITGTAALGEGTRNKQIADRLFISEKTVRHYLTSIFDKLEVSDRLELMIYSYQHGLATIPTMPSARTA